MVISGEQQFFFLVSTFKGPNGFLLGITGLSASLLHARQIASRGTSYPQSHLQAAAMDRDILRQYPALSPATGEYLWLKLARYKIL